MRRMLGIIIFPRTSLRRFFEMSQRSHFRSFRVSADSCEDFLIFSYERNAYLPHEPKFFLCPSRYFFSLGRAQILEIGDSRLLFPIFYLFLWEGLLYHRCKVFGNSSKLDSCDGCINASMFWEGSEKNSDHISWFLRRRMFSNIYANPEISDILCRCLNFWERSEKNTVGLKSKLLWHEFLTTYFYIYSHTFSTYQWYTQDWL